MYSQSVLQYQDSSLTDKVVLALWPLSYSVEIVATLVLPTVLYAQVQLDVLNALLDSTLIQLLVLDAWITVNNVQVLLSVTNVNMVIHSTMELVKIQVITQSLFSMDSQSLVLLDAATV